MDHLVMATEERRRTRGDLFKKLKRTRGCIKKLKRLENELSNCMASPLVTMLPPLTQSEVASILQDIQTILDSTLRQASSLQDIHVDKLIEKGTRMSLWLKDMATNLLTNTGIRSVEAPGH